MIWKKEEDPAESSSYCVITLASDKKSSCCDGAVPVWVLLVTYQLAWSERVDMSPCLPLVIKCLRSSEGKELEKGKRVSKICPFPSSFPLTEEFQFGQQR